MFFSDEKEENLFAYHVKDLNEESEIDFEEESEEELKKKNNSLKIRLSNLMFAVSIGFFAYFVVGLALLSTPLYFIQKRITKKMLGDYAGADFNGGIYFDLFKMSLRTSVVDIKSSFINEDTGQVSSGEFRMKNVRKPIFLNKIYVENSYLKLSSSDDFSDIKDLFGALKNRKSNVNIEFKSIFFYINPDIESDIGLDVLSDPDYDFISDSEGIGMVGARFDNVKFSSGKKEDYFSGTLKTQNNLIFIKFNNNKKEFSFSFNSTNANAGIVIDHHKHDGEYYIDAKNSGIFKDFLSISGKSPIGFIMKNAPIKSSGKLKFQDGFFVIDEQVYVGKDVGSLRFKKALHDDGNALLVLDFEDINIQEKSSQQVDKNIESIGIVVAKFFKSLSYYLNLKINNFKVFNNAISNLNMSVSSRDGKIDFLNSDVSFSVFGMNFKTIPSVSGINGIGEIVDYTEGSDDSNLLVSGKDRPVKIGFKVSGQNINNIVESVKLSSEFFDSMSTGNVEDPYVGQGIINFDNKSGSLSISEFEVSSLDRDWRIQCEANMKIKIVNMIRDYSYIMKIKLHNFTYIDHPTLVAHEIFKSLHQEGYFSFDNIADSFISIDAQDDSSLNVDGFNQSSIVRLVRSSSPELSSSVIQVNCPELSLSAESTILRQSAYQSSESNISITRLNRSYIEKQTGLKLFSLETIKTFISEMQNKIFVINSSLDKLDVQDSENADRRISGVVKVSSNGSDLSVSSNLLINDIGPLALKSEYYKRKEVWKATLGLTGAELGKFLESLNFKGLNAYGDMRLEIRGEGLDQESLRENMSGELQVYAKNLDLNFYDFYSLQKTLASETEDLNKIDMKAMILNQKNVRFNSLAKIFKIEKGILKLDNLNLSNKIFAVSGSVYIDIIRHNIVNSKLSSILMGNKRWVKHYKDKKEKFIKIPIAFRVTGEINGAKDVAMEIKRIEEYIFLVNDLSEKDGYLN